jgi:hypothetical protein
MENNFFCPSCEKQHSIPSYTISTRGYLHKTSKKQLVCDCKNKTALESIEKEFTGSPSIGKIANMSPQQRSEVLKKRASAHFKKETFERKHEMNKSFYSEVKEMGK